jgi:hypothetical protein
LAEDIEANSQQRATYEHPAALSALTAL